MAGSWVTGLRVAGVRVTGVCDWSRVIVEALQQATSVARVVFVRALAIDLASPQPAVPQPPGAQP